MAIFIVDQFSLNTDLPLDIRYVPGGGSYNDVSSYWYPGMQVYQTDDQKIWYADNSLNWHPISEGIDASVSALYQLLADLSTYVTQQVNQLDSSILRIDGSINNIYSLIFTLDSSIVDLRNWNLSQDASISIIRLNLSDVSTRVYNVESSIGLLNGWQISQDASIQNLRNWNISQDASISALRSKDASIDASLNMLGQWNVSQDASIEDIRLNIETSLGLYVQKAGDTMTGALSITNGGLNVIGDTSLFGDLYVDENATIKGNLTVNGSLYIVNVGTLDVSTGFIRLNTGLTGNPPASLQSGVVIERGSLEPYVFLYDESQQSFRIGIASETSTGYLDSSTQAVATRQDSPISNGVAIWNDSQARFDTFTDLTFDIINGLRLDASLLLPQYAGASNLMLIVDTNGTVKAVPTADASLNNLYIYIDGSLALRDTSISYLNTQRQQQDASIVRIDGSINVLFAQNARQDASIIRIDGSINDLYVKDASSIKSAVNIGDGSAGVFVDVSGNLLRFRRIAGQDGIVISEGTDLISIKFDSSLSSALTGAYNILGGDVSIYLKTDDHDLVFRSIKSLDPSLLIITQDSSFIYLDVSISTATALSQLTDVSLSGTLQTHQIVEYDASISLWKNTNNIWWDISLGTTTNDLGGIPAGTNLNNLTLKQILTKILYEYQAPTLIVGTNPIYGTFEKGIPSTQFASIDVSWYSTNANYPLALLNNVHITKTGVGSIYDASLGLVSSSASFYTDAVGITNWGGTNRTITYNVSIDDDQADQPQPAVGLSRSFTFYYRQYWGEVDGNTNIGGVNSAMILALDSSRLAGESNLAATFNYTSGPKIKYLFAYPDTVASPDNFGTLSQIVDQNDFDITGSWDTANCDVSVGLTNVRYRVYLLKNKVDTPSFDVTFKF